MTISTSSSTTTLGGNGSTTVFNFNFVAGAASNLVVVYTDASGNQTTLLSSQYLVSIPAASPGQIWGVGGNVTYPLSGSPIAANTTLTISRILPLTQLTAISNQGDFYPQVVERALDTLCQEIQQLAARTGRILGTWVTGFSYTFGDIVVDGANGDNTNNIYVCDIANTSGTWTTDLANGDWVLSLNVQALANALPTVSNNRIFGNISGATAQPVGLTMTAIMDATLGSTRGAVLYRGASDWTILIPGTSGQVLTAHGTGTDPTWTSAPGTGTITAVGAGAGLSGGGTSGAVSLTFANIANNALLAILTGSANPASATTLSALIDSAISNTQGVILYRGATSWLALAPGTSGQILQTNGVAANPSWANGNSCVLLGSQSASNSAQILFSGLAGSSYAKYVVEFDTVVPQTSGVDLIMAISTGSGIISGPNYNHQTFRWSSGGSAATGATGDGVFHVTSPGEPLSSTASVTGVAEIFGVSTVVTTKTCMWRFTEFSNNGTFITGIGGGQVTTGAAATDGVQFRMNSGNIAGGNFRLYGLKNS